ncbi:hypothetical protein ABK040_003696 [Willaertia magna]
MAALAKRASYCLFPELLKDTSIKTFPTTFLNYFNSLYEQNYMLANTLGFKLLACQLGDKLKDNYCILGMDIKPGVLQPMKILHGGVHIAIGEEACSVMSFSHLLRRSIKENFPQDEKSVVGTSIDASHTRPSNPNSVLLCIAKAKFIGRKSYVWQYENYNLTNVQTLEHLSQERVEQVIDRIQQAHIEDEYTKLCSMGKCNVMVIDNKRTSKL